LISSEFQGKLQELSQQANTNAEELKQVNLQEKMIQQKGNELAELLRQAAAEEESIVATGSAEEKSIHEIHKEELQIQAAQIQSDMNTIQNTQFQLQEQQRLLQDQQQQIEEKKSGVQEKIQTLFPQAVQRLREEAGRLKFCVSSMVSAGGTELKIRSKFIFQYISLQFGAYNLIIPSQRRALAHRNHELEYNIV
jgi:hypothetical protein